MGASAATSAVRTARALFRGPLTGTAAALTAGEISVAHASALTHGTSDLPTQVAAEAEPVLLEAARRMDPPRLRRVLGHLQQVADPDGADRDSERRHGRRGRWLAPTFAGMVALQGLLEAEAGHIVLAALEPLARPHSAEDERSGDQRRADALCELARRNPESGQLPTRLQAAMAPVAPDPGGAPSQPLDVGRASRVITPAQRSALAVRDGGCVFPDCARPLAWCEGHHLVPWQEGGPTDLANLAPLGRQHHRTVHEGGWQLTRGPDGRFTATPPHRPRRHPPPHRRHPTAA